MSDLAVPYVATVIGSFLLTAAVYVVWWTLRRNGSRWWRHINDKSDWSNR